MAESTRQSHRSPRSNTREPGLPRSASRLGKGRARPACHGSSRRGPTASDGRRIRRPLPPGAGRRGEGLGCPWAIASWARRPSPRETGWPRPVCPTTVLDADIAIANDQCCSRAAGPETPDAVWTIRRRSHSCQMRPSLRAQRERSSSSRTRSRAHCASSPHASSRASRRTSRSSIACTASSSSRRAICSDGRCRPSCSRSSASTIRCWT